jgi:hypothetical protein
LDPPLTGKFVFTERGVLAEISDRIGDQTHKRLLRTHGTDTSALAMIVSPTPEAVAYGCVHLGLPPFFSPSLVWDAKEGHIVVASSDAYVLDVFRGDSAASVRRDVQRRPVTRKMVLTQAGEGTTVGLPTGECRIEPEALAAGRGHATTVPAIGSISLAPDGAIWVKRGSVRGEVPIIDIFDAEGKYLGTLPSGSPFPLAFTPAGQVVTFERDENDVQRVAVYRVMPSNP